ncbi:CRISPR type III-a/mtube-associated protein csm2 [Myroides odoratimimus CCUG 12700]|uniref:type III-A CRISPR-associated protein Csm2 n=1 Tax=Myroides odoratimimus TaxID=76832 RepID=UPI0003549A00|nr:type III-A CRISPR-associated protein Csm2 [Myroides odoratimimus]EPH13655.1 CRISPR type III-a/mtube-associated protein csm2 [Myroides odoratimimus CCUG 12700]
MSENNSKKGSTYFNPFERDNNKIFNRDNNINTYQSFLLNDLEKVVETKLKNISKTQMRNVFDLIKNCDTVEQIKMTKPKLMYTAGRLTGTAKDYLLNLSKVVILVKDDKDLNYVQKYIETVLAYHKYYARN